MTIRHWWYVFILLSFAWVQTAQSQNELKVGERIKDVMHLGTGDARKSLLLPSGEWEVLRVAESEARMIDSSRQIYAPTTMLNVVLVQRVDRDFVMLMNVVANKEFSRIEQWWDDPCKRTDTLHRNFYDSKVRQVKCLLVNHIVGFMIQGASTFSDVRQWATREKMNIPSTVLSATLTQFKPNHFLAVTVWVNPEFRKLDSHERAWAASPFHRDYIAGDAERQRYVKEFVNWSEEYMTHLSAAFSGQPEAPVSAFRTQREIAVFR